LKAQKSVHDFRSQLAKGDVAKFNGNKLPRAANMIKLRYDCELEKAAFAHAATCSNSNSDQGLSSDIKRNIQMVLQSTVSGITLLDTVRELRKTWWKQIRVQTQAIGFGLDTILQMAWATTSRLGCGVASCSGGFFVVCHYQPGGNVVNTQVYAPGDPCSNCPTGTYCVSPLCSAV
uniref:SCP domain-containing protein n=1 Tax=Heligmosomoides polygyrus TaxID=6339 RepID=A0A183FG30_HELPZ